MLFRISMDFNSTNEQSAKLWIKFLEHKPLAEQQRADCPVQWTLFIQWWHNSQRFIFTATRGQRELRPNENLLIEYIHAFTHALLCTPLDWASSECRAPNKRQTTGHSSQAQMLICKLTKCVIELEMENAWSQ